MSLVSRRCGDCGHDFSLLTHSGETVVLEHGELWVGGCPKCGGDDIIAVIAPATGVGLGGEAGYGRHYPYFDRALMCRVSSAAHRRQIMKERGLVAVEGDITDDLERQAARDSEERAAAIGKMRAYHDRLDNDPQFADYRRLRDKGFYRS